MIPDSIGDMAHNILKSKCKTLHSDNLKRIVGSAGEVVGELSVLVAVVSVYGTTQAECLCFFVDKTLYITSRLYRVTLLESFDFHLYRKHNTVIHLN